MTSHHAFGTRLIGRVNGNLLNKTTGIRRCTAQKLLCDAATHFCFIIIVFQWFIGYWRFIFFESASKMLS
jgi:hypothetical protein